MRKRLAYAAVAILNALRHPLKAHFPQFPVGAWLVGGILGIALTLAVASLSYRYFEKPLLRRGHQHLIALLAGEPGQHAGRGASAPADLHHADFSGAWRRIRRQGRG